MSITWKKRPDDAPTFKADYTAEGTPFEGELWEDLEIGTAKPIFYFYIRGERPIDVQLESPIYYCFEQCRTAAEAVLTALEKAIP